MILAFDTEKDGKCIGVALYDSKYTISIYKYLLANKKDVSEVEEYAKKRYGLLLCFVKPEYRHKGIGTNLIDTFKNKKTIHAEGIKGSDCFWDKCGIEKKCFIY